mgnify:CR=1 FL=1
MIRCGHYGIRGRTGRQWPGFRDDAGAVRAGRPPKPLERIIARPLDVSRYSDRPQSPLYLFYALKEINTLTATLEHGTARPLTEAFVSPAYAGIDLAQATV